MPEPRYRYTDHYLKLNDINSAWTEVRTYATETGVGQFEVHIAVCSCGFKMEGKDGGDISRQFVKHVDSELMGGG